MTKFVAKELKNELRKSLGVLFCTYTWKRRDNVRMVVCDKKRQKVEREKLTVAKSFFR